mmetsp:Transcript_61414/g.173463  ORF Transcript_61414/g.173463 Transcript_61414/m.173463 type:complete len:217 (-) Transcript_61414:65-715(-)
MALRRRRIHAVAPARVRTFWRHSATRNSLASSMAVDISSRITSASPNCLFARQRLLRFQSASISLPRTPADQPPRSGMVRNSDVPAPDAGNQVLQAKAWSSAVSAPRKVSLSSSVHWPRSAPGDVCQRRCWWNVGVSGKVASTGLCCASPTNGNASTTGAPRSGDETTPSIFVTGCWPAALRKVFSLGKQTRALPHRSTGGNSLKSPMSIVAPRCS